MRRPWQAHRSSDYPYLGPLGSKLRFLLEWTLMRLLFACVALSGR